jgi:hypothetical protein
MDKEKIVVQVKKNDHGWERTSMSLCEIRPDLFKGSLIFLKGGMTKIGIIMGEGRAIMLVNEKNIPTY